MENFDRENIDELLEIRQIRQYFPLSKICAVQYPNSFSSGHSLEVVTNAILCHHSNAYEKMYSD